MKNTVKFEFLSLSENEALARSVAAAFIMPLDPTLEELADVRTAVSEAVTNAIVHGYKKKKGTVRMECRLDGRLLVISITDFGCGIERFDKQVCHSLPHLPHHPCRRRVHGNLLRYHHSDAGFPSADSRAGYFHAALRHPVRGRHCHRHDYPAGRHQSVCRFGHNQPAA